MAQPPRPPRPAPKEVFLGVTDGLKKFYQRKIKPVEQTYLFDQFYSPLLGDADVDAKPMVLLLGQYSVGKTTFIKYMLGRDFPGAHIGPEPTTDKFMAIMSGTEERTVPGNALAVQADKPFRALQKFGTGLLNKFVGSELQSELLDHITFIDTPGVLAGEKQRLGRTYNFTEVVSWFAERADMILLLFDAHKLDISDEFRDAILALKAHDDKVRVVLNKADMNSTQQLMRVYGALMWSLGKCIQTPEVPRVYIGSFWDQPLRNEELRPLFEAEMADLISDLKALPRNNAMRKVNELVKRARLAKVHAYIIGHLKEQMPSFFGREKTQKKLIERLADEFNKVRLQYHLPISDFPNLEKFKTTLGFLDFDKFPKLEPRLLAEMDNVLSVDIPDLLKRYPVDPEAAATATAAAYGNPFAEATPFASAQIGISWIMTDADREKYAATFTQLQPVNSLLTGAQLKPFLVQSRLSNADLMKIWGLSDIDRDAKLNFDEFCICMYLVHARMCGSEIPGALPETLLASALRPAVAAAPGAVPAFPDTPEATLRGRIPTVPAGGPPLPPQAPVPQLMYLQQQQQQLQQQKMAVPALPTPSSYPQQQAQQPAQQMQPQMAQLYQPVPPAPSVMYGQPPERTPASQVLMPQPQAQPQPQPQVQQPPRPSMPPTPAPTAPLSQQHLASLPAPPPSQYSSIPAGAAQGGGFVPLEPSVSASFEYDPSWNPFAEQERPEEARSLLQ